MALRSSPNAAPAAKDRRMLKEIGLFTLIYLVFFSAVFLPVILRDGFILGGDGYNMYYPLSLNFRSSLLEFIDNIKNGSFEFPMMNFNFGFGTDNLTLLANQISFLPYYIFCVFIPESLTASFLTVSVFVLDWVAGIAFLKLCHHFSHHSYWNSLMAFSYACSSCFLVNYLFNPHFMHMLVAFPLMVIGIDRVIHKNGWRLLCFCIFWLGLTSFTLLIYMLPFLGLFALIRIGFVYKEHYFRNVFRCILRCIPIVAAGVLLSGFLLLPTLYLLVNSTRSIGNTNIHLLDLLIPSPERLSDCFYFDRVEGNLGIGPILPAIPGLLLTLLVIPRKKEIRAYLIAALACVALPLIDYGLNGFQYSLIRWGAVSALAFSFAGSVGITEFSKLEKRKLLRTIGIACVFAFMFSSSYAVHYEGQQICAAVFAVAAVLRMFPFFSRLWTRFCRFTANGFRKFAAALKDNTPSVRHYAAIVGFIPAVLTLLIGIFLLVVWPEYTRRLDILVTSGILITVSIVLMYKKQWTGIVMKAALLCLLVFSVDLFYGLVPDKNENTAPAVMPVYQMTKELQQTTDCFSRSLHISYFPEQVKELEVEDIINPKDAEPGESVINWDTNYALGMHYPDCTVFHNMMDNDLFKTMERCGQDAGNFPSMTLFAGFSRKEVLSSLFGIRIMSTESDALTDYGLREIKNVTVGTKQYRFYENQYALPLGVTYDSYLTRADAETASASCYPFAMLEHAFAETADGGILSANTAPDYEKYRCDISIEKEFSATNSVGMDVFKHHITVSDNTADCFLFLELNGVASQYQPYDTTIFMTTVLNGEKKKEYQITNKKAEWNWNRTASLYSFALGYQEEDIRTIDVKIPAEYESISVYAVPASVLTDAYAARTAEHLENVQITTNHLEGDITVSSEKLLSVSFLHNSGWRVEVDGEEAPLYKVNGMFLGAMLPAGTHHVRFIYRTAWLMPGLIATAAGVLLWIAMEIVTRRKRTKGQPV